LPRCAPVNIDGQRGPALRFGDPRVQALLSTLVVFRLLPDGFSNKTLRAHLAPLVGLDPDAMTAGQMTYELRRLRLHRLIERVPHTNRYQVTSFGLQVAMFFTRAHNRLLRTGLSQICDPLPLDSPLRRHLDKLEAVITDLVGEVGLAA
jgi:ABC-type cobalamin transport system ATPase subunit